MMCRVDRETVGQGALNPRFFGSTCFKKVQETSASRSVFQNRFDTFDKGKTNRGFEHENNFQEVNQQNSST
jgi:hypothetical protein